MDDGSFQKGRRVRIIYEKSAFYGKTGEIKKIMSNGGLTVEIQKYGELFFPRSYCKLADR